MGLEPYKVLADLTRAIREGEADGSRPHDLEVFAEISGEYIPIKETTYEEYLSATDQYEAEGGRIVISLDGN